MKYVLILSIIILGAYASGKSAIQDEKKLLIDILTVLEDPDNGYPYSLRKVYSVTEEKVSDSIYVEYKIDADLKDENGELQTCAVVIRAFPSDVVFYVITFSCPDKTLLVDRVIV